LIYIDKLCHKNNIFLTYFNINKKVKNIIYKKTNKILKNKIRRYKENDENYIKIEELNEIISSSDTDKNLHIFKFLE
jgi:hypothetical protein